MSTYSIHLNNNCTTDVSSGIIMYTCEYLCTVSVTLKLILHRTLGALFCCIFFFLSESTHSFLFIYLDDYICNVGNSEGG